MSERAATGESHMDTRVSEEVTDATGDREGNYRVRARTWQQ